MAISVGSVEVDVVPNAQGIEGRLRAALVPPASQIGDEVGRIIGRQIVTHITPAVRDGINAGARAARPAAARQGDETAGAFSRSLKARLEAAFRSLPKANVTLATTGFDADMARLRARLETLSGKRIGIDVDAGTAMAEITDIETRLKRLGAEHPNVQVRADTAAALAQLAALRAEVSAVDGKSIDIDTQHAVGGFSALTTAALAFGPAILPVIPVVLAGLGAIAAAATAAGAGIGGIALVAVPAFKQMGTVLQAQKAAQQAATTATLKGGQASSQAAQRSLQMASAQQALATAQRNGARQIRDAQQGVVDAERQAAQANAQATQQVKQARQSLADAYQQASERMQQANQQVASAERDLEAAQKNARQAQQDLTQARKDAAQQLEDLNNRLTDSALSQRDAEIALKEATAQRNAVLANANSTELDKQKALLAYDQAVQRLKEQTTETKRLKTETAAANKAGVEGSTTVKTAQDRLAQAQQDVIDKTAALKTAQANVAKTQIQNTRAIADAQQKLSEAQKNVALTQQQGAEAIAKAQERVVQAQQSAADSVASAQRQIASASLAAAGGVDQAAIAQAKYQQELAKLTPSARATFQAFLSLKSAFSDWSKSLQPAVMPIFTRALVSLRNTLPTLTPFVKNAADAIKGLQDRASAEVKRPFWQGFKKDLQGSVKPAITGLGVAFGNLIKGMAGIIDAFLPHMDGISSSMQRITQRFANWGANLKGSPAFESFLSYASQQAPILGHMFGQLFGALIKLGVALNPMAGTATSFINAISGVVNALPVGLLTAVGVAFASIAIGSKLAALALGAWKLAVQLAAVITNIFTGEQWALNTAMEANPIGFIVTLIASLVVALIYAYQHVGWFRAAVQAAWDGIKIGALFLWNSVLKPAFDGIMLGLRTVGRWAMWLWTTAIKPAFDGISLVARILATAIVVLLVAPVVIAIKILGAIGMWLWKTALKPAFEGIASVAKWLWTTALKPVFQWIGDKATWLWNNAIKPAWDGIKAGAKFMWETILRPIFKAFVDGLKTVGGWAKWLYDKAIKPAWDAIVSAGKWAWEHGIKPIFDGWKRIINGLGDVFNSAVSAIKTAWDKIKDVAKKPVQFVVDTIYNKGIVGVWNAVAGAFGAPKLDKFKFASGGIMPGYTPGRDVHRFLSPTGGALELSGGEAIMRPEFTRAVGSGFVGAMNSIAKSRGARGVKAALAPVFGGNPNLPTDTSLRYANGGLVQRFADGGIFGWIKSAGSSLLGAGSAAWNNIKKGASWLADTLEASARAGVKNVVDPLLRSFPGMDTGIGQMIRHIPDRIIDALFGYSKEADKRGAGGIGGPRVQAALNWAKTQAGKPYQLAGNGDPSWDCSGFMSAIESVIRGQKPHRRWATMAFSGRTAPPGWVYHGNSAFRIGITNAGVGHTAGTLGRTNVESRGGAGVLVGSRARGYNDGLFTSWYGFMPGKYDSGGYLQPGFNLAYNGTGRPEPVFTTSQANALTSLAARGGSAGPARFEGDLYLDSGEFLGRVRGEAQQVMQEGQRQLMAVINAS